MRRVRGREVVLVNATRTAIGKGHPEKGHFRSLLPQDLLAHVFRNVLTRPDLDPIAVEDVFAGCVQQIGHQGSNIARNAWMHAGLPVEVPATTMDRQCGSSQTAVNTAAAMIASGAIDVAVGAGVEHMGRMPFANGLKVQNEYGHAVTANMQNRFGIGADHMLTGQGSAAEAIASEWKISRLEMEELAVRSHALAHQATTAGAFEREIAPITVDGVEVSADQGIRPETNLETLASLRPVFRSDGLVTAATSSQVSDGAAAVLLMSSERAAELGVRPRARILDQVTVGVDPRIMLTGPIPATDRILKRNGLRMGDVDVIEINEAFASVVAAWIRELKPDVDRVNPWGGAMALGHPLGASGARLITTLLHYMEDEDKELGLVTMCCGGGLGTASLIERP